VNNLYEELELNPDCSFEEIKQQYRLLAKKHHPDMGGDAEKFKKIKLAYEVLSDPKRRAEYDKTGNYSPPTDIQNEAKQKLAEIFYLKLQEFNPNEQDIVELIKQDVDYSIVRLNDQLIDCDVLIKKLETIKSKIFIKDTNNDNLFFSFIDTHVSLKQNDKKYLLSRLDISHEMLRILNDYNYGFIKITNSNH